LPNGPNRCRAGRRLFLEAHQDGPHAEAAHAEIERLRPTPPRQPDAYGSGVDAQAARAEVSDGRSPDAKAASEVVERAAAGMEVATLTSDEICKRDGDRLERLRSSPKSDEASRFANDFGCEKLRTQPSALMQNLARAPSAQVVAHPKPPVEVGSAPAHVPSAPAGAHPRPFVELGSASAHARSAPAAAHPRPSEEVGLALSQERRAPVRPDRTRWTASHSTEPTPYANTRRVADRRTQYLVTMWLECPVDETGDRPPSQGCLLSERP
jgi:hypothetical protein